MTPRRFPAAWTPDEMNDARFIVRDANGQALGYFYFEDELGRPAAAKLLTRDEARRVTDCRECCVTPTCWQPSSSLNAGID